MSTSSKKIRTSDLDFDDIKANLKDFLRGQSQFSDYDFDGSGLNILLDVLAYNTHYNALYQNLAINEAFLDSASKRNSVVSHAKLVGYTPASSTASIALITLSVTNPNSTTSVLTLPKLTPFSSIINNTTYTFYTRENISALYTSGAYTFTNIKITEGSPLTFRYNVAEGQKYIIPNINADLSTLSVRVQESSSSDIFETYVPAANIVDILPTSKVYFIKEIDNGLYEIAFGDNIISKGLINGNVVHLDYFVSNKSLVNGARQFRYEGESLLDGVVTLTTLSPASGGAEAETIDSIKFNAPKYYAAQNRAVTAEDYKALIYAAYPSIKSISVWGGEDNNPPVYGKVFICAKPLDSTKLTSQQKSDIISTLLANKNVVSISPVIVDPSFISIILNSTVYYNDRESTKTSNDIKNLALQAIFDYDDTELQKFDCIFRYSKLSRLIDTCDSSIVSNITTVMLRLNVAVKYNSAAQYILNIINPIYTSGFAEESVVSSGFYISGRTEIFYLQDDGIGNMQLFYNSAINVTNNSSKVIINPFIGTVDYVNGLIKINNLNITSLAGIDFEFHIKPESNDVVSAYTQIAEIDRDNLIVNVIADPTANGDLRAGKNFTFKSSRV